jgi:hypothetical protein
MAPQLLPRAHPVIDELSHGGPPCSWATLCLGVLARAHSPHVRTGVVWVCSLDFMPESAGSARITLPHPVGCSLQTLRSPSSTRPPRHPRAAKRSIARTLDVVSTCKNLRTLAPCPSRENSSAKRRRTCSIGAPAPSVNDLIVRSRRAGSSFSVSVSELISVPCWMRSVLSAATLRAHAAAPPGDRRCGGAHIASPDSFRTELGLGSC